jgi:hypothetical protein
MSLIEDQLRDAMVARADQARPVPMLQRLDAARAARAHGGHHALRRPAVLVAAALVSVALVAVALVAVGRWGRASVVDPVDRPPQHVHLTGGETTTPGRADLTVVLHTRNGEGSRAWLWAADSGSDRAVVLAETPGLPWGAAWTQQLSADGTHLVRQHGYDDGMELIDLRTGTVDDLGGRQGYCPALSPDNATVAFVQPRGRDAVILNTRTRHVLPIGSTAHDVVTDEADCTDDTFAWSPDGTRIALLARHDTTVVDIHGRLVQRIQGAHVTNSSMSWSPDGRRLLMYQRLPGRYVVVSLADRSVEVLPAPVGALRPLGWAGSRVVWLAGRAGDLLVVADEDGSHSRVWCRLDVADRAVRTVQWSDRLAGTGR